jgi:hypothetical protein
VDAEVIGRLYSGDTQELHDKLWIWAFMSDWKWYFHCERMPGPIFLAGNGKDASNICLKIIHASF